MPASTGEASSTPVLTTIFAGLLALTLVLHARPAAAQTGSGAGLPQSGSEAESVGQPIQLAPPSLFSPEDAGDDAPPPAQPPEARDKVKGIEVDTLDAIDPEAIGVLGPEAGGFGIDMWHGSQRATVEALLQRLPDATGSFAARDLAHRLLLSNALPPRGAPGSNLMRLRIERLAALADAEGLAALLRVVPRQYDDAAVARIRADSLLLDGDIEEGCREIRNAVTVYGDDPNWSKGLVFCQIIAGEAEQAGLTLNLLREQGEDGDRAFFALVEALSGAAPKIPAEAGSSALTVAMLRMVGGEVPAALIEDSPAPLLAGLAAAEALGPEARAAAGERAAAVGALSPEGLAEIYAAFTFDEAERAAALSSAGPEAGSRARALLFQEARDQTVPAARAEILGAALAHARAVGLYPVMARVLLPFLAEVPPEPSLIWFAETAGRALFVTGRLEQAAAWLNLARALIGSDPEPAVIVARLWPYARLAGQEALTDEESLAAWRAAKAEEGAEGDNGVARAHLLLRAAFQALGATDPLTWSEMAVGAEGPPGEPLESVPLLYAVQDAAAAGRTAEGVLIALVLLGRDGPGSSHPVALASVLSALMRVGLTAEARALAIEAALDAGL